MVTYIQILKHLEIDLALVHHDLDLADNPCAHGSLDHRDAGVLVRDK